jgi:uncharacterized protein YbjQ (UPF0145 family)
MSWILLLQIGLPLGVLLSGYGIGRWIESRHYAQLRERERALQPVIALSTRWVPAGVAARGSTLVSGSVVVSTDAFKRFVAGFRALFGGQLRGYETLLDRARREAVLRMKQQAQTAGARLVIGVRLHTTQVTGTSTPAVEVMAFGTALFEDGPAP